MPKKSDSKEIPSMKYLSWGLLNGLILGIIIKQGIDISEGGIATVILDAFKPIFQNFNMSVGIITFFQIILGLIGIISLLWEIYSVYNRGWPQRVIAFCGFLSFLLLIVGVDILGVIFLFAGAIMVRAFPNN